MRKSTLALILVLSMSVFAFAAEYPVGNNGEVISNVVPLQQDRIDNRPTFSSAPAWDHLDKMTRAQRDNSNIVIELEANVSVEARQLAGRIADLWNSGDFTKALQLFPQLETLVGDNGITISNNWRTPVETEEEVLWGSDVRIGNHTDIYDNEFDVHRASGNLFAVLAYTDGSTWYWSMNISTNDGDTWTETYEWWAGYQINDVAATVLDDWCYVGYIGNTGQTEARLRRFNYNDGSTATFPDGSAWVTAFTASSMINEAVLTSNQDFYDNRIYYYVLLDDGTVTYYWDDPDGLSFEEIAPGISDAREGLGACTNEGYATYFTFLSYLTDNDEVKIYGKGGTWDPLETYSVNSSSTDYTSIGAYHDTITCVFDYNNGSNLTCRYLVNYTGGSGTWYYGDVGSDPNTTAESPDLTARGGGGVGIVWRYYSDPRTGRYVWRNYGGTWSNEVVYTDYEPYYNQPNIEYMGNGVHGTVYLRWSNYAAYFDKNEPTCLAIRMVNNGPDPVRRGSRFNITGYISNTCNTPTSTDVWYGVLYNNNFYQQGVFHNIPLGPNQTQSGSFWQRVPGYAPPGTYTYIAYAGHYPSRTVEVQTSFNFGITALGVEGGATEWSTIGGMFKDYEFSGDNLPGEYALVGNYPNPFNAATSIQYDLPAAGDVRLEVFNLMGQKVATLVDGYMPAGQHSVTWDASTAASGVYFYKLAVGNQVFTRRMTLLK